MKKCSHWLIDEEGKVVDAYKNLTSIFECTPQAFFEYFIAHAPEGNVNNREYYNHWLEKSLEHVAPDVEYSNVFVIKHFLKRMPSDSILHLSILNSIRISHYFELPQNTKVYANVGTDGIDGCLSSFFGQSVATEKECFIIVGDLSFFYDMGAMRIKHMPKTARILMINNYGGGEFHYSTTLHNDPTMDLHTSAAHSNIAEGWVKSVGFEYIPVHKGDDYNKVLDIFFDANREHPVFIEFFSDMETDATITHLIENNNKTMSVREKTKEKITKVAHKVLNGEAIEKINKILR